MFTFAQALTVAVFSTQKTSTRYSDLVKIPASVAAIRVESVASKGDKAICRCFTADDLRGNFDPDNAEMRNIDIALLERWITSAKSVYLKPNMSTTVKRHSSHAQTYGKSSDSRLHVAIPQYAPRDKVTAARLSRLKRLTNGASTLPRTLPSATSVGARNYRAAMGLAATSEPRLTSGSHGDLTVRPRSHRTSRVPKRLVDDDNDDEHSQRVNAPHKKKRNSSKNKKKTVPVEDSCVVVNP